MSDESDGSDRIFHKVSLYTSIEVFYEKTDHSYHFDHSAKT